MKFVLTTAQAYWWPVTVRIPDPDQPGRIVEQAFKALLQPQDQDEYFAEQERIEAIRDPRARATAERQALAARVRDWDSDVVDASRTPVPFSADALDLALRQSWFRAAIWKALNESALGEEARLGN